MITYKPIINTILYKGFDIGILRLDLIHPQISGNKWFKLKYNLQQAKTLRKNTIITFGGAFSNHIAATAVACKINNLKTIGIIRGEYTSAQNTTLTVAQQNGMELLFVTRTEYSQKDDSSYLQRLQYMYPDSFIVPEGGDNYLGKKGCEEIFTDDMKQFTDIFCAYGTGTTFNGISATLSQTQMLTAINVLKYKAQAQTLQTRVLNDYHFGGYAKHSAKLLEFKLWFEKTYAIELDYVYTSKLFYAVFDLINQNKLAKHKKILIIHSGGLQGNNGYERRYNLNPNRHVNDPQG